MSRNMYLNMYWKDELKVREHLKSQRDYTMLKAKSVNNVGKQETHTHKKQCQNKTLICISSQTSFAQSKSC